MAKPVYLILENGTVLEGQRFGADGELTGEVVFTTAMTGYLETLTDPSYYGQIVVQTFPLIGNYGVISSDFESSSIFLKGYIVHEWCQVPSNFRSEGELDTFLASKNIVGITGIDTRALTKMIREKGVMNGRISDTPTISEELEQELRSYKVEQAVLSATISQMEVFEPEEEKHHVALWDFGAKANIRRELVKRGCKVSELPASWSAEQILALNPDGIMLSNGPGDPAENTQIIQELAKLLKSNIPVFGICLGHQLLALAKGGKTQKLRYGHRGANQPVKDLQTGRVYITSQNHGYCVCEDALPKGGKLWMVNGNDGSCEGIEYTDIPAFSVQYHPEGCGGPMDTEYLFDRFINMMEGR